MNDRITVVVLVEGQTEKNFISHLLAEELGKKNILLIPIIIGGNVKFTRVQRDIERHLKQWKTTVTYITTFVDYYGVEEWPGVEEIPQGSTPTMIAQRVNDATRKQLNAVFPDLWTDKRFIPYMSIHEFEALLFSDSAILASKLNRDQADIDTVLVACGEPEAINDSPQTAPSKRLDKWWGSKFPKTTLGIDIARAIGIPKMREKCPLFNDWLERLEALAHDDGEYV